MSDVAGRVIKVLAAAENLDAGSIGLDSTFESLGIDSVAAISIAFDIETEFDIDFSDDGMFDLKCVQDIVDGVEKLLAEKG